VLYISWEVLTIIFGIVYMQKIFETEEVENTGWVGPSETPTCLLNNLITFEFTGIQNVQTELDFTRYIINRSSNLNKVKISTPNSNKRVERSLLEGSNKSSVRVWVWSLHTFFSLILEFIYFFWTRNVGKLIYVRMMLWDGNSTSTLPYCTRY